MLEAEYFPPIELSANKNYALRHELLTFNSITNVDEGKNKFYIDSHVVTILPLSYEIENIDKYIQVSLANEKYSVVYNNSDEMENHVTTGAYNNNRKVHTIHEFFPTAPPGYKIIEVPSYVIHLPIAVKTIHHIQLQIVDQDRDLVNFRGETITIRLHIKLI